MISLDALGIELEEAAAAGNAGVVDEKVDRTVPAAHSTSHLLDREPVAHVAHLWLGSDLGREPLEPLAATGE